MEKTTERTALISLLLIKYNSGDKIRKNEIGEVCST